MKKVIFTVSLSLNLLFAFGQTTDLHLYARHNTTWLMYFGDHKISDKWGIHLEAQLRRDDLGASPQQLLLRTGINYHFHQQAFATFGYCFVETYPYGEFPSKAAFPEHRFWEQLQVKNQIGCFEHIIRARLEQRFSYLPFYDTNSLKYIAGNSSTYTNRARLLNRVSIPFNGKTILDKSFYATIYDEIFINFGKHVANNIFDQNRLYLALGYKIPKAGRLELGYLLQTIQKGDGIKIEQNRTLQLGLLSTLDFYKKKKG